MKNWIQFGLSAETLIKTSSSEFIIDEIVIEWLKHFIQHTNSGPLQEWKILLMNNHDSHENSQFVLLTNQNHIRLFLFISHLTHCMQSLNVDIFNSYKKHHDNVIKKTLTKFDLFYTLKRFCNDLDDIRENTFKRIIIRFAFKKFDMWSINLTQCIAQLKKFAVSNIKTKRNESVRMLHEELRNEKNEPEFLLFQDEEFSLSLSTRIESQTCKDVKNDLLEWLSRIRDKTQ
jgi:hypothetical protein